MSTKETNYPREENMGSNCMFWTTDLGCTFPKAEIEGRRSCEGMVDDVCLFLKDGRRPTSLTKEQIIEIKTRRPDPNQNINILPGNISNSGI